MSFPLDLHSAAVSDSHLPCRSHAIPDHAILLKATAQHGRRERACGLTAHVRLLPAITGVPRSCQQMHTNLRCRWPVWNQTPFVMDEEKSGSSTLQKRRCYLVRIFPATMRTFTKDTAMSGQGSGAAWHVCINARHGRGTAYYVWIGLKSPQYQILWTSVQWYRAIAFRLKDVVKTTGYKHFYKFVRTPQKREKLPSKLTVYILQKNGKGLVRVFCHLRT